MTSVVIHSKICVLFKGTSSGSNKNTSRDFKSTERCLYQFKRRFTMTTFFIEKRIGWLWTKCRTKRTKMTISKAQCKYLQGTYRFIDSYQCLWHNLYFYIIMHLGKCKSVSQCPCSGILAIVCEIMLRSYNFVTFQWFTHTEIICSYI